MKKTTTVGILMLALIGSIASASPQVEALKSANSDMQKIYNIITVLETGESSNDANVNTAANEIQESCQVDRADVVRSGTPQVVAIREKGADRRCPVNYTFSAVDFDLNGDRTLNTQITITSIPLLGKLKIKTFAYAQVYKMRAPDSGLSEGEMNFTTENTDDTKITGETKWKIDASDYENIKSNTTTRYSVKIDRSPVTRLTLVQNEVIGEDNLAIESKSVYKLNNEVITQAEAFSLALK